MAKHKPINPKATLPFKVGNKLKRESLNLQRKKARDTIRRDERFRRKREEDRDPELKQKRLANNVPMTIDRKRTWDDYENGENGDLGVSIDVEELKRRRIEAAEQEAAENSEEQGEDDDSMLDSDSDVDEDEDEAKKNAAALKKRSASIAGSTSTNLDLTPDSLALKFPSLFTDGPPPTPKILITTSINSTLHNEAQLLCDLFPNATYVRRSQHRFGHKYSIREISKFAHNRAYTALVVCAHFLTIYFNRIEW